MNVLDRVLIILTGLLLATVVAICWSTSTSLQRFTVTEGVTPWPLIIAQALSSMAGSFALAGLASAAGLLFLRAARWTGSPADDEEVTPEPSP